MIYQKKPTRTLCPMPRILEEEYTDGYNRGFLKGREDAQNQ